MMKFHNKPGINYFAVVAREKALLLKHYSFLKCEIKGNVLYCYGSCQPAEGCVVYNYRIKYDPSTKPVVTVTSPLIVYNDDIHMYPSDNSLCLYHKSDLYWTSDTHLFNTIIPWTHEWFVFYELWKLTGRWLHPFVPHKGIKIAA
ncbi:MAG TPA: hypothetical protein VNZ49_17665 [Bacteroidia bacterium]|nr:hypothetical protein [Bacteroidia bacterium]